MFVFTLSLLKLLMTVSVLLPLRYPLGRVIGGTVYPGLTLTAGSIWWWVFEIGATCLLQEINAISFVISFCF